MSKLKPQQQPLPRTPIEIACLPDEAIVPAAEVAVLLGESMAKLVRWRDSGLASALVSPGASPDLDQYRLGAIRRWWALSPASNRSQRADAIGT